MNRMFTCIHCLGQLYSFHACGPEKGPFCLTEIFSNQSLLIFRACLLRCLGFCSSFFFLSLCLRFIHGDLSHIFSFGCRPLSLSGTQFCDTDQSAIHSLLVGSDCYLTSLENTDLLSTVHGYQTVHARFIYSCELREIKITSSKASRPSIDISYVHVIKWVTFIMSIFAIC